MCSLLPRSFCAADQHSSLRSLHALPRDCLCTISRPPLLQAQQSLTCFACICRSACMQQLLCQASAQEVCWGTPGASWWSPCASFSRALRRLQCGHTLFKVQAVLLLSKQPLELLILLRMLPRPAPAALPALQVAQI